MRRLLALSLILLPLPLAALEVRVHPGEVVYAYEADPAHWPFTVMLQNVAIVQKDGAPPSRWIPITFKNIVDLLGSEGSAPQAGVDRDDSEVKLVHTLGDDEQVKGLLGLEVQKL